MCRKEDKLLRSLSINVSYVESWKQSHLRHYQLQTYLNFVCLMMLPSPIVVWIFVGLCLSKIYFQRILQCTRSGLNYLHVHFLLQCTSILFQVCTHSPLFVVFIDSSHAVDLQCCLFQITARHSRQRRSSSFLLKRGVQFT